MILEQKVFGIEVLVARGAKSQEKRDNALVDYLI
jgi:hypothetical protein